MTGKPSRGQDGVDSAERPALARVAEVLRHEGPAELARKLLARTVYRRVILIALDLGRFDADPGRDVRVTVRRLDDSGVAAYLRLRPDQPEAEVRRRLGAGHLCFVTHDGGQVSSAVWFRADRAWIPEIERWLALEHGQVYAYDSFTAPELRGRGIATARGVRTCALLRDVGYRSLVGFVLSSNRRALGPPAKLGFRPAGSAGFFRLGRLRLDFERGREGRLVFTRGPAHAARPVAGSAPVAWSRDREAATV